MLLVFLSVQLCLLTLLAVSAAVRTVAACDCVGCFDPASVSAGSTVTVSMGKACGSGKYAAVSAVQVQSTDGSTFSVQTYNPPDKGSV